MVHRHMATAAQPTAVDKLVVKVITLMLGSATITSSRFYN